MPFPRTPHADLGRDLGRDFMASVPTARSLHSRGTRASTVPAADAGSPFPRTPRADIDFGRDLEASHGPDNLTPVAPQLSNGFGVLTRTTRDLESTSASSKSLALWKEAAERSSPRAADRPQLLADISRDTKEFRYNPQWKSWAQSGKSSKRCFPPKLWVLLLLFFLVLMSLLTFLTTMWYVQNAGAVHDMGKLAGSQVDELDVEFDKQTNKLIEMLHWQSGQIEDYIVGLTLQQPPSIVGLNQNLLAAAGTTSTKLNLDFVIRWMWLQLSEQFLGVEGVSLSLPSGLYVEFERDAQRAGLINTAQDTYTMEFAPPAGWNGSDCPMFCPQAEGIEHGQTYQFSLNPATGSISHLRENYSFSILEKGWYIETSRANGSLVWYGPYPTISSPPDGAPQPSMALRAGRAHMVQGEVAAVLASDITLDYLSFKLGNFSQTVHDSQQGGVIFIMDFEGKMVSHSKGMGYVVKYNDLDTMNVSDWRWLANESACKLTRQVAAHIMSDRTRPMADTVAEIIYPEGDEIIYTDTIIESGDPDFGGIQWIVVDVQHVSSYKAETRESILEVEAELWVRRQDLESALERQVLGYTIGTWGLSVILGVATLSCISRKITRPLRQIHKDMRAFAKFDPDTMESMITTGAGKGRTFEIREIAEICDSFSYMAGGLQSFARYMDAHLVQILVRSKRQAQLGMAPADVTIFFSDLVGFTTLAESMDTAQLMELLGTYLEEMSNIVMNYGGVVGEFIGDAIMAWWNAPPLEYGEGHSEAAVAAALKQQRRLAELNDLWRDRGLPEMKMRMGLARGRVLSGNLGSSKRMKYGLVGDSVNLASRLEGLCKRYGVASLVEDNVHASVGVAERFLLRPIDLVTVKGRTQPTELFELVDRRPGGPPPEPGAEGEPDAAAFCRLFAEAHALFRAQRFAEALAALEAYQERWPGDEPAHLLQLRCEELLASPPGPGWSPVTHLTEK